MPSAAEPGLTRPALLAPDGSNGPVLRVALAYMAAGLGSFLLLGLLGLLMRLDQSGWLVIAPGWFYRIMTLHGAGMVTSVLLAALGGLAAAVSSTTRLNARVLWVAFMLFMLGTGLVIVATLVGGFAGGWTVLYPLPGHGQTWPVSAALTIYVGYLVVALGHAVYCFHMIAATSRTYGGLARALAWPLLFSGGRNTQTPVPRPPELVATVTSLDGLAASLAGLVYLVPLFARMGGLVHDVDALFAKNFVYIFGHTVANLGIYVAAGLVYAAMPAFTGRSWRTTWAVALAWNLLIVMILINYSHHLYADFAQPEGLQLLAEIASYAVALPSFIVTIIGALTLVYRSGMRWTTAPLLMVVGIWGWVFGGLGALLDATIPINQVMHNTMWVPAHFHTYYLLGAVAFAWGYLFHMVRRLSDGRDLPSSRVAAWLYGIGGAGFVLMFFIAGANSVPRRYAVHPGPWALYARVAVPFVVLLALALASLSWDLLRRFGMAWRGTNLVAAER